MAKSDGKFGMKFQFQGIVIMGRELKSKSTDWSGRLFKLNSMLEIHEMVVDDPVMIQELSALNGQEALVKGVIENYNGKLRLVPENCGPLKIAS